MSADPRILVLGYGNPCRVDDGLGPALASAIEALGLPGVHVEASYQPAPEDAALVAEHEMVVFVDADVAGGEPFELRRLGANGALPFSTHRFEPAAVLALAEELYGARPVAYAMGIRGYDFETFDEGLSPRAERNLREATAKLRQMLEWEALAGGPEPG